MYQNYNVKYLLWMARDYLDYEESYQEQVRKWKGHLYEADRSEYAAYVQAEARSYVSYYGLMGACDVVGADIKKVIGLLKAMNRYEKRENWQVCAQLPWKFNHNTGKHGMETVIEFLAKDRDEERYYESTGREKRWIE